MPVPYFARLDCQCLISSRPWDRLVRLVIERDAPCRPSSSNARKYLDRRFYCAVLVADSALAASMALATDVISPCLPFYAHQSRTRICSCTVVVSCRQRQRKTHAPLCESQVHFASLLGQYALVVLERSAHDSRCYCEVAIVAVVTSNFTLEEESRSVRYIRYAGGFPRKRHCVCGALQDHYLAVYVCDYRQRW